MTDHETSHDGTPEIAPDLSGPAYPQQPADGERPVPLRRMPERTQDPNDWDVAGTESSQPRDADDVVDERRAQEESARESSDERDAALTSGTEHESSYSSEIEQGAAQPRPDGRAFQQPSHG
jgi:hypothetical protein